MIKTSLILFASASALGATAAAPTPLQPTEAVLTTGHMQLIKDASGTRVQAADKAGFALNVTLKNGQTVTLRL